MALLGKGPTYPNISRPNSFCTLRNITVNAKLKLRHLRPWQIRRYRLPKLINRQKSLVRLLHINPIAHGHGIEQDERRQQLPDPIIISVQYHHQTYSYSMGTLK